MSLFSNYRDYLRDNPKGYWFKRKLYGWGWTPVRWQGWLAVCLYLLTVLSWMLRMDESASILPIVVLTMILISICYVTGEKPRWQWGFPEKDKKDRG